MLLDLHFNFGECRLDALANVGTLPGGMQGSGRKREI